MKAIGLFVFCCVLSSCAAVSVPKPEKTSNQTVSADTPAKNLFLRLDSLIGKEKRIFLEGKINDFIILRNAESFEVYIFDKKRNLSGINDCFLFIVNEGKVSAYKTVYALVRSAADKTGYVDKIHYPDFVGDFSPEGILGFSYALDRARPAGIQNYFLPVGKGNDSMV